MAEGDRYKPELRRYPDDACSSFICFVEAYAKIHGGPSPQSWRTQVSPVFVQGIQMAERTENHRHTHHAIEENQEGYAFAFLNMELSRFYHSSFCKLAQGACQEIGYNGFGRNSFRKSEIQDLSHRFKVKFKTIQDYEAIRRHVQR